MPHDLRPYLSEAMLEVSPAVLGSVLYEASCSVGFADELGTVL